MNDEWYKRKDGKDMRGIFSNISYCMVQIFCLSLPTDAESLLLDMYALPFQRRDLLNKLPALKELNIILKLC